ncbi:MAG: DUF6883 domain-containing protein [Desulfococcaceae bacterium]
MKLPENTLIAYEKLTRYLLVFRERNDKSLWLAKAGFTLHNWKVLENALRTQILTLHATLTEDTQYGQTFEIKGKLIGPNGNSLSVCTIWMTEDETQQTKFITMYPDRKGM